MDHIDLDNSMPLLDLSYGYYLDQHVLHLVIRMTLLQSNRVMYEVDFKYGKDGGKYFSGLLRNEACLNWDTLSNSKNYCKEILNYLVIDIHNHEIEDVDTESQSDFKRIFDRTVTSLVEDHAELVNSELRFGIYNRDFLKPFVSNIH